MDSLTKKLDTDYIQILMRQLKLRQKHNGSYSGRTFARDLGISVAFLSYLMNGERVPSEEKALQIANKLNISLRVKQRFILSTRIRRAKTVNLKENLRKESFHLMNPVSESEVPHHLTQDLFQIISDWQHYPIIELLRLKNPPKTIKSLSLRLGISECLAQESLERLERVGLTTKSQFFWKPTFKQYSTGDIPSTYIRKYHSQILKKAQIALTETPPTHREYSSIVVSVSQSQLNEAKLKIREFRQEMLNFFDESTEETKLVYSFNMQLFPLDHGSLHVFNPKGN